MDRISLGVHAVTHKEPRYIFQMVADFQGSIPSLRYQGTGDTYRRT